MEETNKNYFIRITTPYTNEEWLRTIPATKVICYQHEADEEVSRTHWHILVWNCEWTTPGLKKKLISILGQKVPKTEWSFKTATDEGGCITYMSKGHLDPYYMNNFAYTAEYLNERKSMWIDPKPKKVMTLVDGKLVAQDKDETRPTISKRNLLEQVTAELPANCSDVRTILIAIRKVLIRNNQVLGFYKVKDFYECYVMYHDKETFLEKLMNNISRF